MEYNFREIEKKWQDKWAREKTFATDNHSSKSKFYVLDMFPYPSGAGLHVGHPLGYIASDIYSRYKRHRGFNVLHPMGYDAFGLPAEQYAIQTGQHPKITTEQNINRYREQLDKMGFSFDWDREVKTCEPEYYKWTQWIFLQLFNSWYNKASNKAEKLETLLAEFEKNGNTSVNAEHDEVKAFSAAEWKSCSEKEKQEILMCYRIAYLSEAFVNWCPQLGTVLANDEVKDGVSERGGYPVERKLMKQWSMRITAYAERLLNDLEAIDWSDSIKDSQRNWIGKSEGTSLKFYLTPGPSPKERGEESSQGMKAPGYYTADPQTWRALHDRAKEMRNNPTPAEGKLWQAVRKDSTDHHFRRQHIIDRFIVDFVCLEKMLVVEVDGDIHDHQKDEDEARAQLLMHKGYTVIRFRNEEVMYDLTGVIKQIEEKLHKLPSFKVLPSGEDLGGVIEVFTTRPDTIFGVSFVTLAPEHELVSQITTAEQKQKVEEYIVWAKNRSERERQADVKKITGVFTGAYVQHPFTGKDIPVWVGDYVLAGYGTGAVMAVPAHDIRDFAFANHFKLPIIKVVSNPTAEVENEAYDGKEGTIINSDFLNGLSVKDAIKKAIEKVESENLGKGKTNYRLRDAVFGRQRYWGEPIPIYYKEGIPYAVDEKDLPIVLPEVDKYLPTESGEPPLARAKDWNYKGFEIEKTTMPGWAGSSWYFLRYMDAKNDKAFVDRKIADYWKDIDLYIGGSEHATGHLLYVRFWTKALYDLGFISVVEPAKKLINQGMIQGTSCMVHRVNGENKIVSAGLKSKYETTLVHIDVNIVENNVVDIEAFKKWRDDFLNAEFELEDGKLICATAVEKMSKRWYNVVNPDDICDKYGADCLRLYEMFLGPLELSKPWNTNGITGVSGFLRKLWRLFYQGDKCNVSEDVATPAELKTLHKTIKKIIDDIERYSFNTSVSNFMICVNELGDLKCNKRSVLEPLIVLLSPYAPHIAEELWSLLGHKTSVAYAPFPVYMEEYTKDNAFDYPVSFNGKTRFKMSLPLSLTAQEIEKEVMSSEEAKKHLDGKTPKKVIVVPNKIVNIVI